MKAVPFFSKLAFLAISANAFQQTTLSTINDQTSFSQLSMGSSPKETSIDRRNFITIGTVGVLSLANTPAYAKEKESLDSMINELKEIKSKLEPVPGLLAEENWEGARGILKTPPVNYLWNVGVNTDQNTLVRLSKLTEDIELLELKDELAISLQICDQIAYGNVFIYFQPGSGKVKIKEPIELAKKAMSQIDDAIARARSSN
mmetsp:Transcript_15907/g.17648  ORF Transcript_15907/g.17648 Transcript_15907/m.17648 type:complete len:203 (+) Transcript_15907:98-706(+)|eukprot:CAMPEP_0194130890 /NCGR_PEP_ID=MMETSP0152-20130528/1797_1 /TAXON_ID=1049557 /ORGANISM="Thalassiothrix antarctica, Strain L6-D1" /LENGTH=202 /DNA_ID=CAMNT_0038825515 /DNA_START=68 /DNA_END=676 /DNA_ORIENTATION=+